VRLLEFLRSHPEFAQKQPVRFHFYLSIIDAYDRRFHEARQHNRVLLDKFGYFNSKLQEVWRDSANSEPIQFEAIVEKKWGRKVAHVSQLQNSFYIRHSALKEEIRFGDICLVELRFLPSGIVAIPIAVVKSGEF
jgi:hypothetical protein